MEKTCANCSLTKPIDEFPKHPRWSDGHWNICKPCYNQKQAERRNKQREANAGREPDYTGFKLCCRCKQGKRKSEFYREAIRHDGLSSICKQCNAEVRREIAERRKAEYSGSRVETKQCAACGQVKDAAAFTTLKSSKDGLRGTCRVCESGAYQKIRWEVLCHYSNGSPECACCGETQPEFLSIDHVNGGGNQHRKSFNLPIYKLLKKEGLPEGYRVLCHNCNQAIGYHGYCPHERARANRA